MNIDQFLDAALSEDVGAGDITTEACGLSHLDGSGHIIAKEGVVVCGQGVAQRVFERLAADRSAAYVVLRPDGEEVERGTRIATIKAPLDVILTGERLALNLLMKLSGIATHTRRHVTGAGSLRVVDTRKTTPLLRDLEKYAVRCGGASNHRFALYDGVMIKDNHIAAVGDIATAVRRVRARAHHLLKIEVEVGDLDQLDEALAAGADVVLLDNMDDTLLREAVARARSARPEVLLEASGNMTAERVARISDLGLDVVSVGGLIHQATWVDLSLEVRPAST